MATTELTWYGGYRGVRWNADNMLHLVADDGLTFCKIGAGLRPATRGDATRCSFCIVCTERAQDARRDVA